MAKEDASGLTPDITQKIHVIRGQRVLLDEDLAAVYGTTVSAFNQAVRRNLARFPPDFVMQLSDLEEESLRSQFVILKRSRGRHRKYPSLVFTEHGAVMAAAILNSPRAVQMSIYVVRAFIKMRTLTLSHAALARELAELKKTVATIDADTRRQFDQVFEAILGLMNEPARRN
jgi:phage regulator Rha-like protein